MRAHCLPFAIVLAIGACVCACGFVAIELYSYYNNILQLQANVAIAMTAMTVAILLPWAAIIIRGTFWGIRYIIMIFIMTFILYHYIIYIIIFIIIFLIIRGRVIITIRGNPGLPDP